MSSDRVAAHYVAGWAREGKLRQIDFWNGEQHRAATENEDAAIREAIDNIIHQFEQKKEENN